MEKNKLFREKNIERISSPEQLNDYVKVTNTSIWIVLIGVVVLIAGAFIWAVVGKVDSSLTTSLVSESGTITCYLRENDLSMVTPQMDVMADGSVCRIDSIEKIPVKAADIDEYVLYKGSLEGERFLYPVKCSGNVPDGIYEAKITLEQVSPITFIFN